MNRFISFTGGTALAVAVMLASGPSAYAQHHGGGGGGGFHGGGFHGGGMGGYHGGYGGFRGGYGGFGGGYGGYGGYRGYGGYGYGYGYPGLFLGLGGYDGYYGNPGYYDYGYAPNYYNYSPTYVVPQSYAAQTQSAYPPSTDTARLVVRTPANAQVWVDNYLTNQIGPVRELTTPGGLEPGQTYHYTVKARWTDNGKPVEEQRTVNFQAGQTSELDFTKPAT
jgi:uncharacterized protein (TIGR03000 family)